MARVFGWFVLHGRWLRAGGPRVDEWDSHGLEVGLVAGDECEAVDLGGGRDERVVGWAPVGHVESCCRVGDSLVNIEQAARVCREHVLIEP
jgi:hypothetical protein